MYVLCTSFNALLSPTQFCYQHTCLPKLRHGPLKVHRLCPGIVHRLCTLYPADMPTIDRWFVFYLLFCGERSQHPSLMDVNILQWKIIFFPHIKYITKSILGRMYFHCISINFSVSFTKSYTQKRNLNVIKELDAANYCYSKTVNHSTWFWFDLYV